MQKLAEFKIWGGTKTEGAVDRKAPKAALTRNITNDIDGSCIKPRGGSENAGWPVFDAKRSWDTLWAFTNTGYPGKVFIVQASAAGRYVGETWTRDITGTTAIKAIGVYAPDNVDSAVTPNSVLANAAGGMILSVRGDSAE